MRVFEIVQRRGVGCTAYLENLPAQYNLYDKSTIQAKFTPMPYELVTDCLVQNDIFISGRMKSILDKLEPRLYAKKIDIYNNREFEYWLVQPKIFPALHHTLSLKDKSALINPILSEKFVQYHNVFSVIGLSKKRWFVSLKTVEYLLRYHITGFYFKEVVLGDSPVFDAEEFNYE